MGLGGVALACASLCCVVLTVHWATLLLAAYSTRATTHTLWEHVFISERRDVDNIMRLREVHEQVLASAPHPHDPPTFLLPCAFAHPSQANDTNPTVVVCSLASPARNLSAAFQSWSGCKCPQLELPLADLVALSPTRPPALFVLRESSVDVASIVETVSNHSGEALVMHAGNPIITQILDCNHCSLSQKKHLLRVVLNAIAHALPQRHCAFLFDPSANSQSSLLIKALPYSSWLYVFDDARTLLAHVMATNITKHLKLFGSEVESTRLEIQHAMVKRDALGNVASVREVRARLGTILQSLTSPQTPSIVSVPDAINPPIAPVLSAQDDLWVQMRMFDVQSKLEDLSLLPVRVADVSRWQTASSRLSILHHMDTDLPSYKQELDVHEYLPYPELRPLVEFLTVWPPDQADIPAGAAVAEGSLARFNYSNTTERAMALNFRINEVPFMLYGIPQLDRAHSLWTDEYVGGKFGAQRFKVTQSVSNHFMYYNRGKAAKDADYKPSTSTVEMDYRAFVERVRQSFNTSVHAQHFYLQMSTFDPNSQWINDELDFFRPKPSLFMADPAMNRGINCRFGSRGVIAEAHFDEGRNFIALVRGAKRYIILPPSECLLTYLYPIGHPEGRHIKGDWSKLDLETYPLLAHALATQVVIRAGEVLYLPSEWLHYPISLDNSIQCNARSGISIRGRNSIRDCGFYPS
eukprot:m.71056 g.71056  ORF g.71056 m.71056 type:complete len:695 (-) comp50162_c0_seq4:1382-3466(-)